MDDPIVAALAQLVRERHALEASRPRAVRGAPGDVQSRKRERRGSLRVVGADTVRRTTR